MLVPVVACVWAHQLRVGPANGPYYLLNPIDFASRLDADYEWALKNIPLFESANSTLDNVYLFRWRTLKSQIRPTGSHNKSIQWVITEFAPKVGWAGKFNTINCAAGHHMAEIGWMREPTVMHSYTRWWTNKAARLNYYYWFATALFRHFERTGDLQLAKSVLPSYVQQFLRYGQGKLPTHGARFDAQNDCLWNAPGNEGQEHSISGPGCRPLVNSLMYGEAAAIASLCFAIGDVQCAAKMATEANRWQQLVLRMWNTNLAAFDTLQLAPGHRLLPPLPMPPGWELLPAHSGRFCCDQSPCVRGRSTFLFEGRISRFKCVSKCLSNSKCTSITVDNAGWCMNNQHCTTTHPWGGPGASTAHAKVQTWRRTVGATNQPTGGASNKPLFNVKFAHVRELASLSSPWFFGVVPAANATVYQESWRTAFDPSGLGGPNGLRTAEKRHPKYTCGAGCCDWSGPVWPFETSKTISAAINVLNNYPEVTVLGSGGFWKLLWPYVQMHTSHWKTMSSRSGFYANLTRSNVAKWLFKGLGELWLAEAGCGDKTFTTPAGLPGPGWTDSATQGYRYNHATFVDLVLSGVVGLQPRANGTLIVNPLVPANVLPWWAVDGVALHRRIVSVIFDADGSHYSKTAKGLTVLIDGAVKVSVPTLSLVTVQL